MTAAQRRIEDEDEGSPLDQVRELIGEDAVVQLSMTFGGRTLYVPKTCGAHHPITAAIGQAPADLLAGAFGGNRIDVPLSQGKRRLILKLAAQGLTRQAIAAQLYCHERTVYRVIADDRDAANSPQQDFFS